LLPENDYLQKPTPQATSPHSFHIPVMGTGFTIDTPLRVARYGISSVISIGDDILIEIMRKFHCDNNKIEYQSISSDDINCRSKRITAYLNLVDTLVKKQFEHLKNLPFEPDSDITRYFELLPDSQLKSEYQRMLELTDCAEKKALQASLRQKVRAGSIDVNIMTKVDGDKYYKGEKLPSKYATAMSAMWGFADSNLNSSIILSAGLNRRLFEFMATFDDFLPDKNGILKKKIILKVSDYRSALIQAKLLARHGLWVSEYRIESGLNCGGHAFATRGFLIGPILEEFLRHRDEMVETLGVICSKALKKRGIPESLIPENVRITLQGGIGTADEDKFLRQYYNLSSIGWGTPFLLVPEATNVDSFHLKKLVSASNSDVYLSECSPLGIPFWNLKTSTSEETRRRRIKEGRPGSPCPKGYLGFNTELTEHPICVASRAYQKLKLKALGESSLPETRRKREKDSIMNKSCICLDLAGGATMKYGLDNNAHTAVCCGPGIADFDRVSTLKEMIDHIYGRKSILKNGYRPHMLNRELMLYIEHLRVEIEKASDGLISRTDKYFREFKYNLLQGVAYYQDLAEKFSLRQQESFLQDLEKLYREIEMILPGAVGDSCFAEGTA
jgi:hypothetical protein